MMLRLLLLAIGILLILTIPVSAYDPFMAWAVTDPPFTSLTYGIQTFLWWDEYAAGLHIDWVRLMVFSHIKQTFAWEDLEPEPDVWNFSRADAIVQQIEEKGLRLIVRLSDAPTWAHPDIDRDQRPDIVDAPADNPSDWADYCGTVAARYAGRIAGYQIWNEPNLSREWGGREPDAAGYAAMLQTCATAIRAADPEAVIISAGMAPTGTWDATAWPDDLFLQRLYDLEFQQWFDVLGVHAPGYAPPEIDPADAPGGNRFFSFRRVEDIRRLMIRNGDAARQMAILEVGWTTDPNDPAYSWFAVDEETQARHLVEAYRYAAEHWSPWVGLMSAIYIADTGWTDDDEERWWAITTPDNYVRPAYIALANMAKYCGEEYRPARAPDSPEALGLVPVTPCR